MQEKRDYMYLKEHTFFYTETKADINGERPTQEPSRSVVTSALQDNRLGSYGHGLDSQRLIRHSSERNLVVEK